MILSVLFGSAVMLSCGGEDPYQLWHDQPNQKLVFMSRADALTGELYSLNKNDLIVRLTNNNLHDDNLSLSPDGRKIAFLRGSEPDTSSWEVYVMDLDTRQKTRVTDNAVGDGHPDWSPDGNRIVYISFQDASGNPAPTADICVINPDGTGFRRLTDNPYMDDDPEWSPDGSRIAFKSTMNTMADAREEIFLMDSGGANIRRLTTSTGWQSDHDPSWNPDGGSIVFCRYTGKRPWTDIAVLDSLAVHWSDLIPWNVWRTDTSGNLTQLTDVENAASLPAYSSDGAGILYNWWDFQIDGNNKLTSVYHRLVLMDSSGGHPERLIPDDRHNLTLESFDW
jgi:Tol biopolymer transport system component